MSFINGILNYVQNSYKFLTTPNYSNSLEEQDNDVDIIKDFISKLENALDIRLKKYEDDCKDANLSYKYDESILVNKFITDAYICMDKIDSLNCDRSNIDIIQKNGIKNILNVKNSGLYIETQKMMIGDISSNIKRDIVNSFIKSKCQDENVIHLNMLKSTYNNDLNILRKKHCEYIENLTNQYHDDVRKILVDSL